MTVNNLLRLGYISIIFIFHQYIHIYKYENMKCTRFGKIMMNE